MKLRAMRRDRAARTGPELFLLERAFDDCVERIELVQRRFERALLIGCPDPGWPKRLPADQVSVIDPGKLFAAAGGGQQANEDEWQGSGSFDLVVAVGTLDTVNDLPGALRNIRAAMAPEGFFIGAMSGGDTLPQLRRAIQAADALTGAATPHVHPRIEASAVAPLLQASGFQMPVVDVDRVQVSYRSFDRLIKDLRGMGGTNILSARSRRPLSRSAAAAAAEAFVSPETFEMIHFAAWSAPHAPARHQG